MAGRCCLPIVLGALALAAPAAAQSCWPVGVLLALRDADGAAMAPAALDSVALFHRHTRPIVPRPVVGGFQAGDDDDPRSAVLISLAGCRLRLDSVQLRRGETIQTLVFDMDLDSDRRQKASVFSFETPPFGPGRHRLRCDPMEDGGYREPVLQPAAERWLREPPR